GVVVGTVCRIDLVIPVVKAGEGVAWNDHGNDLVALLEAGDDLPPHPGVISEDQPGRAALLRTRPDRRRNRRFAPGGYIEGCVDRSPVAVGRTAGGGGRLADRVDPAAAL